MSFGTKRFAGLALGLLAVFAASLATPAWAQDLTPVGYWALDDGQIDPFSTTAVDSSVNGNNGTLWNFPSTPTWGTGLFGAFQHRLPERHSRSLAIELGCVLLLPLLCPRPQCRGHRAYPPNGVATSL